MRLATCSKCSVYSWFDSCSTSAQLSSPQSPVPSFPFVARACFRYQVVDVRVAEHDKHANFGGAQDCQESTCNSGAHEAVHVPPLEKHGRTTPAPSVCGVGGLAGNRSHLQRELRSSGAPWPNSTYHLQVRNLGVWTLHYQYKVAVSSPFCSMILLFKTGKVGSF